MKKLFVFIITLTVLLCVVSTSLAHVGKGSREYIASYIGVWYAKEDTGYNKSQKIIMIGLNDNEEYVAIKTDLSDYAGGTAYCSIYHLSTDFEADCLYLTEEEASVSYKLKIIDGKLYSIPINSVDTTPIIYEKLN